MNVIPFSIVEIFNRWIRHDLNIIFPKYDRKNFDLSFNMMRRHRIFLDFLEYFCT